MMLKDMLYSIRPGLALLAIIMTVTAYPRSSNRSQISTTTTQPFSSQITWCEINPDVCIEWFSEANQMASSLMASVFPSVTATTTVYETSASSTKHSIHGAEAITTRLAVVTELLKLPSGLDTLKESATPATVNGPVSINEPTHDIPSLQEQDSSIEELNYMKEYYVTCAYPFTSWSNFPGCSAGHRYGPPNCMRNCKCTEIGEMVCWNDETCGSSVEAVRDYCMSPAPENPGCYCFSLPDESALLFLEEISHRDTTDSNIESVSLEQSSTKNDAFVFSCPASSFELAEIHFDRCPSDTDFKAGAQKCAEWCSCTSDGYMDCTAGYVPSECYATTSDVIDFCLGYGNDHPACGCVSSNLSAGTLQGLSTAVAQRQEPRYLYKMSCSGPNMNGYWQASRCYGGLGVSLNGNDCVENCYCNLNGRIRCLDDTVHNFTNECGQNPEDVATKSCTNGKADAFQCYCQVFPTDSTQELEAAIEHRRFVGPPVRMIGEANNYLSRESTVRSIRDSESAIVPLTVSVYDNRNPSDEISTATVTSMHVSSILTKYVSSIINATVSQSSTSASSATPLLLAATQYYLDCSGPSMGQIGQIVICSTDPQIVMPLTGYKCRRWCACNSKGQLTCLAAEDSGGLCGSGTSFGYAELMVEFCKVGVQDEFSCVCRPIVGQDVTDIASIVEGVQV